jgi:transcription elongation factor SPT5
MPPRKRMMDSASDVGSETGSVFGGDDDDDREAGKREMEAARKAAKAQKRARSQFIDDDVEVEDEEGASDDDDEDAEDGDVYEEDAGAEQVSAKQAERENRQFDVQRRLEEDAKLQEQVRERFEGENAQRYTREALEEDEEDGSGARFRDLPDATRDPRMWLMKCKPNQEKMLVIQLMQKFLDSMHTDKPLQIKSAACTDIKGYIYIEAYKELHVREATQGLNNLFYKITQVGSAAAAAAAVPARPPPSPSPRLALPASPFAPPPRPSHPPFTSTAPARSAPAASPAACFRQVPVHVRTAGCPCLHAECV